MAGKKAQIAMEYLILTGFILVAVALIFGFSFINYNQNIRIAKTSEAISKLSNAVDDIYTRGEGNTRFVKISWPDGMKNISIVYKCLNGTQQDNAEGCGDSEYGDVEFSVISMEVQLLGEDVIVMERTKAKIKEKLDGMDDMDIHGNFNQYSGSTYIVKVSWTSSGLIQLERV